MSFKNKASVNRFLLGLGCLGVLVIVLFYFYSPYAIQNRKLKNRVSQLREETRLVQQEKLPSLEIERTSLKEVQENYEEILKKIKLAEGRIPSKESIGKLLKDLNRIAKEKKVDFIQVRFKESKDLKKYTQIPIDINLKCNMEALVLYLDGLEKLPRLVKVNFIKITADKDNGSNLDIFLGAESYVLKES